MESLPYRRRMGLVVGTTLEHADRYLLKWEPLVDSDDNGYVKQESFMLPAHILTSATSSGDVIGPALGTNLPE